MIKVESRRVLTYKMPGINTTPGIPQVKFMGNPPYSHEEVVHLVVQTKYGVDLSEIKREFASGSFAGYSKYKTYVSFGMAAFKSFIDGGNHISNVIISRDQAIEFQTNYLRLENAIKAKNEAHERALDEIKDQGDVEDSFKDVIKEFESALTAEERLLERPDFVINSLPIHSGKEIIEEIAKRYWGNPAISLINVYNTGEHVLEFGEALSDVLYFAEKPLIHSFIINTSGRTVGFILNKTLVESLGIVSFIKSIYPNIDLLLIAKPSARSDNPVETEKIKEANKMAVIELMKLKFTAGDIITVNGSRDVLVDATANKLKGILAG